MPWIYVRHRSWLYLIESFNVCYDSRDIYRHWYHFFHVVVYMLENVFSQSPSILNKLLKLIFEHFLDFIVVHYFSCAFNAHDALQFLLVGCCIPYSFDEVFLFI